jgi:Uma2 family endonuclease
MVAIADKNLSPIAITTEPIWRLSVTHYHSMIASGILTEDDQIELLEGLLIAKMPKNPQHSLSTKLLRDALEKIVPVGWYVDSQEPITLDDSEPEPDVMVVCGSVRDYSDRHPAAKDLELVIEVSSSTLERDRTLKQRIYARAGIPIYWILNLGDRQLEVYTQPTESRYEQCQVITDTESVSVNLREKVTLIPVGSLLS